MRHKRVNWAKLPDVIRYAFQVAHRPGDVWTACRMADRMHGKRGGHYGAYLQGRLIPEGWEEDRELFESIRDSAHEGK